MIMSGHARPEKYMGHISGPLNVLSPGPMVEGMIMRLFDLLAYLPTPRQNGMHSLDKKNPVDGDCLFQIQRTYQRRRRDFGKMT